MLVDFVLSVLLKVALCLDEVRGRTTRELDLLHTDRKCSSGNFLVLEPCGTNLKCRSTFQIFAHGNDQLTRPVTTRT